MGFRLHGIRKAFFAANQASSKAGDVPKGFLAVYVGEKMKRFLIPVSYLNQPSFQDLLNQAAEEFGYDHPNCGLRIPCSEDIFLRTFVQIPHRNEKSLHILSNIYSKVVLCTSTAFEDVQFETNRVFLIPRKRKPINVVCVEKRPVDKLQVFELQMFYDMNDFGCPKALHRRICI
ncbi:hypothetical protein V8G54_023625 [Vigna mungo]|uniref:Uncharacterized protein n=1 Tax=Vigna mungo TaxID=3915 RepID=A0AAQ3N4H4_VIGMU